MTWHADIYVGAVASSDGGFMSPCGNNMYCCGNSTCCDGNAKFDLGNKTIVIAAGESEGMLKT